MSRNALAARAISREPDAAVLLEMLGLTVDGVLQPDDDRVWDVAVAGPVGGRSESRLSDTTFDARPKVSTAPAALRDLAPAPIRPAPFTKAKGPQRTPPKRTLAPCGTYGARRRHMRNGEPLDELCQKAPTSHPNANVAKTKWRRLNGIQGRKLKPCGTDASYRRHIKYKDPTCLPCLEAHNKRNRELEAKKAAS